MKKVVTKTPKAETATEIVTDETSDKADGPQRRCLVSGEVKSTAGMIRFVLSPDATVTPDIAACLPGRGLWLSARHDMLETASKKRLFNKAARQAVTVPEDLTERVEALLLRRALDLLGFARRAGEAVAGLEKVRAAIENGKVGLILLACDGSPTETGRMARLAEAKGIPALAPFTAAEMGRIMGRDLAVHLAVDRGTLAQRLRVEAERLAGFRNPLAEADLSESQPDV